MNSVSESPCVAKAHAANALPQSLRVRRGAGGRQYSRSMTEEHREGRKEVSWEQKQLPHDRVHERPPLVIPRRVRDGAGSSLWLTVFLKKCVNCTTCEGKSLSEQMRPLVRSMILANEYDPTSVTTYSWLILIGTYQMTLLISIDREQDSLQWQHH